MLQDDVQRVADRYCMSEWVPPLSLPPLQTWTSAPPSSTLAPTCATTPKGPTLAPVIAGSACWETATPAMVGCYGNHVVGEVLVQCPLLPNSK